jgi:hypothetical protein
MRNAFAQYDETWKLYNSYRWKNISGNILLWGGFAAALAGVYIPFFSRWDYNSYENNLRLGVWMMAGGLVSELIGSFILRSGQESIFRSVNIYNRNKIREYNK